MTPSLHQPAWIHIPYRKTYSILILGRYALYASLYLRASDNEFSLGGQIPKSLPVEQNYVFSLYLSCLGVPKEQGHYIQWSFSVSSLCRVPYTNVDTSILFVLCPGTYYLRPSSRKCKALSSETEVNCEMFQLPRLFSNNLQMFSGTCCTCCTI